jgi:very-short-patch-repair endonuclease
MVHVFKLLSRLNSVSLNMESHRVHNKKTFIDRRKQLRNSLTSAEAYLWKFLQSGKLKRRKFRRQHGIGVYVLDFYCPQEKLAIELDGAFHFDDESAQYDDKRTRYLNTLGIEVIRFENVRVFEDTEVVLHEITSHFKNNTL